MENAPKEPGLLSSGPNGLFDTAHPGEAQAVVRLSTTLIAHVAPAPVGGEMTPKLAARVPFVLIEHGLIDALNRLLAGAAGVWVNWQLGVVVRRLNPPPVMVICLPVVP